MTESANRDELGLSSFQQALLVAVPALWRPYIVYRSKDVPLGARKERRGWERGLDRQNRRPRP